MNDQRRQSRTGDPVECRSDGVECDDDDDTGRNTSGRSSYTRFGLQRRSRERTSRWVGSEQCTESVVDSNSDELLVGVDLVSVESTERLGNGDVFEQEDDGGDWKMRTNGSEELAGDMGLSDVLQSRRNIAYQRDPRVRLLLTVNEVVVESP